MYTTGKRRHRWLRWALLWAGVTAAIVVAGLVIEAAVTPAPKGPQSLMPAAPRVTSAPASPSSPMPSTASSTPAFTGPVQVVAGTQEVNGVQLGFPHSTAGAVSAADWAVAETISTLDPDRAAAVMRMIAAPSWPDAAQQAAEGVVNDRQGLGLPTAGPVPAGASLQTEPVEYQVRDVRPDGVLVLLLSDFITTVPAQGTATRIAVFPVQMAWSAGDWRVAAVGGSSYVGLAAEPDSPQSAAEGWQELEPVGG